MITLRIFLSNFRLLLPGTLKHSEKKGNQNYLTQIEQCLYQIKQYHRKKLIICWHKWQRTLILWNSHLQLHILTYQLCI